jgi:hypothetical protein
LSLFIFLCAIYFWVNFLREGFKARHAYIACFLSGLAIGTKLDSLVLICAVGFIILYIFVKKIYSVVAYDFS